MESWNHYPVIVHLRVFIEVVFQPEDRELIIETLDYLSLVLYQDNKRMLKLHSTINGVMVKGGETPHQLHHQNPQQNHTTLLEKLYK
ncbi:unnamed protein product [Lupinus luteus]|uniref:Uncharacterized protein n=1 Tax=Lupinus luteus TaxID=3873 RepID=A0AAV1W6C7_LUPLU